ncbi:hypothetical protein GTQ40_04710 [Flavobacteriaceae bacterium R38]|nr:hypothetical protein [Flavobacteriaceae bacterium R38]
MKKKKLDKLGLNKIKIANMKSHATGNIIGGGFFSINGCLEKPTSNTSDEADTQHNCHVDLLLTFLQPVCNTTIDCP